MIVGFWGTFAIPLINFEINVDLNWSENCVSVATDVANQGATFSITGTKLYAPVVTSSTQDNAKLLEQLKRTIKRTINWNKYQPKVSTEYLHFLFDPSFPEVNRPFALLFENEAQRLTYNWNQLKY